MECKETVKSYHQDLWGLFEKLLDTLLVPDWNEIMKKETATEGWIAKGGVRKINKRGKLTQALVACVCT